MFPFCVGNAIVELAPVLVMFITESPTARFEEYLTLNTWTATTPAVMVRVGGAGPEQLELAQLPSNPKRSRLLEGAARKKNAKAGSPVWLAAVEVRLRYPFALGATPLQDGRLSRRRVALDQWILLTRLLFQLQGWSVF